ncbi:hypothetical protein LDENG_00155230, partial [Lucifuga dentata]
LAEEEERSLLPSGAYTTAEARPNSYIPQDDLLPLPKPYGALTPFKPSRPAANMRHIQKPAFRDAQKPCDPLKSSRPAANMRHIPH